jgi:hypothetical protein
MTNAAIKAFLTTLPPVAVLVQPLVLVVLTMYVVALSGFGLTAKSQGGGAFCPINLAAKAGACIRAGTHANAIPWGMLGYERTKSPAQRSAVVRIFPVPSCGF